MGRSTYQVAFLGIGLLLVALLALGLRGAASRTPRR